MGFTAEVVETLYITDDVMVGDDQHSVSFMFTVADAASAAEYQSFVVEQEEFNAQFTSILSQEVAAQGLEVVTIFAQVGLPEESEMLLSQRCPDPDVDGVLCPEEDDCHYHDEWDICFPVVPVIMSTSSTPVLYTSWEVGEWGSCDAVCGTGVQRRIVICPDGSCSPDRPSTEGDCVGGCEVLGALVGGIALCCFCCLARLWAWKRRKRREKEYEEVVQADAEDPEPPMPTWKPESEADTTSEAIVDVEKSDTLDRLNKELDTTKVTLEGGLAFEKVPDLSIPDDTAINSLAGSQAVRALGVAPVSAVSRLDIRPPERKEPDGRIAELVPDAGLNFQEVPVDLGIPDDDAVIPTSPAGARGFRGTAKGNPEGGVRGVQPSGTRQLDFASVPDQLPDVEDGGGLPESNRRTKSSFGIPSWFGRAAAPAKDLEAPSLYPMGAITAPRVSPRASPRPTTLSQEGLAFERVPDAISLPPSPSSQRAVPGIGVRPGLVPDSLAGPQIPVPGAEAANTLNFASVPDTVSIPSTPPKSPRTPPP